MRNTNSLNRRDFLKIAAAGGVLAAGFPLLESCSTVYQQKLDDTWNIKEIKDLSENDKIIKNILRFGILAPSIFNTQPWEFSIGENEIKLFPDFKRRLKVADPEDRQLQMSLGCILENIELASVYNGFHPETNIYPQNTTSGFIQIKLQKDSIKSDNTLFNSITTRHTNKREYDKTKIAGDLLKKIEDINLEDGDCCIAITDKPTIRGIFELIKEGNERQIDNLDYMNEYVSWIRFNDSDAEEYMDGMPHKTLGISSYPGWLGRFLTKNFMSARKESIIEKKRIDSSGALLAILADSDRKKSQVLTGKNLQRILLTLTSLNIKYDFINQPCQVLFLRSSLKELLQTGPLIPQILLRIGYAPDMPHSPRRRVEDVIRK